MNAKSHITTFKWRHINAFPVHLSSNNSLEQCAVHAHEIVFFSREAWTVLPWRAFWIGVLNQRFKTLILPSQNKHERSLNILKGRYGIPTAFETFWSPSKENRNGKPLQILPECPECASNEPECTSNAMKLSCVQFSLFFFVPNERCLQFDTCTCTMLKGNMPHLQQQQQNKKKNNNKKSANWNDML